MRNKGRPDKIEPANLQRRKGGHTIIDGPLVSPSKAKELTPNEKEDFEKTEAAENRGLYEQVIVEGISRPSFTLSHSWILVIPRFLALVGLTFVALGFGSSMPEYWAWIGVGVIAGWIVQGILSWLPIFALKRENRRARPRGNDDQRNQCNRIIDETRWSVRAVRNPDPEWIGDLSEKLLTMVKRIAEVYYPDTGDNAYKSPKGSEAIRASIELATILVEFLQRHPIGRKLDRTVLTYENYTRRVLKVREKMDDLKNRIPERIPVDVIAKTAIWSYRIYNGAKPTTWISLVGKNLVVREGHAKIVSLVGDEAIRLYGGTYRK